MILTIKICSIFFIVGVWGLSDTQGKDDNILAIDAARLLGVSFDLSMEVKMFVIFFNIQL